MWKEKKVNRKREGREGGKKWEGKKRTRVGRMSDAGKERKEKRENEPFFPLPPTHTQTNTRLRRH